MTRIHLEKRRDFLKGACGVVAAGGVSSFVPQLNMMGTALAQGTFNNYKALVCIYLDGGNDSWNMLIPATTARHNEYVAARGGLYEGAASSLGVPISGGGGTLLPNAIPLSGPGSATNPNSFALNPFVSATNVAGGAGIHRVYNRSDSPTQRLAFLANIGPLVAPVRKSSPSSLRPPQLYSHNDQQNLWLIGGGANSSDPNGWGGRMVGTLLGLPPASGLSPCISVAGQTRFLVGSYSGGGSVVPYRISTNAAPAVTLSNYGTDAASAGPARRAIVEALMDATYPQQFSDEYSGIITRSIDRAGDINDAIGQLNTLPGGAAFNTALNNFPANNGLANQLRQVARMIAVCRFGQGTIQATRQIYYVRTGGYDTHDGQIQSATAVAGHHNLLRQLSTAMAAFDGAMRALNAVPGYSGVYNEVLTMTNSEFARTVNSNGNGTDHAWGAVQMLMGGAVVGNGSQGQVVGPYPRQILGLSQNDAALLPEYERGECFNRGEFLPRIAVDQLGATIATWMGVSPGNIDALFPRVNVFANAVVGAPIAFRSRTIPNLLVGVA